MYIMCFQYLNIWKSNLFITSYTVYICSNIYHTTLIKSNPEKYLHFVNGRRLASDKQRQQNLRKII
jgi:chromosome condensin MukBEF MukE localization factor